jgi:CubicO group peptidase (beta-lactamase class C family)
MQRTILALLLAWTFLAPACQPTSAQASQNEWPTTTPEEQGIDSAKLAAALLTMREQAAGIHSLMVIRDGKVLVDATVYPYAGSSPHDLGSVTKSVLTTLIGIAIAQGKLQLDDPVLSFFPDRTIANHDERKERMTVADLARNTSGLACLREPGEPTQAAMAASDDWVQFVLDLPMAAEPGSRWEYCSPGFHLLSAILTEATGTTALDFAWQNLFGPLAMRDVIWPADPQGYTRGAGDLMLRPHDAAKLGQLWLNRGIWAGRTVVSPAWVEAAATAQATTYEKNQDYGYGWWIVHDSPVGGEFRMDGRGGQFVDVLPALDMVVATTGAGAFELGDVTSLLAPALIDPTRPLPPNPAALAMLAETVASLGEAPTPQPTPSLPAIAAAISDATIVFPPNPTQIATIRLGFAEPEVASLEVAIAGAEHPIVAPVGLDGVYRFSPGDFGLAQAARGAWTDPQTLVLEYTTVANNDAYELRLRFAGKTVVLELTDRTRGVTARLEGTLGEQ